MKVSTRILSLLLALAMIITVLPAQTLAADVRTPEDQELPAVSLPKKDRDSTAKAADLTLKPSAGTASAPQYLTPVEQVSVEQPL